MKAWRLRDIERLAIQQWVADKFGKASDGRRMERVVLLSSILEGWNWRHRSASNQGGSCAPLVNRVDTGSCGFKSGARNQQYLEFCWAAA
jgi:hypothetical protein